MPEPTVERLDLDEGSWVDVVRGLVPRGDEVHDAVLSSASGSRARCSATSGGSTPRGRWPATRPGRNRPSTRSTPGCDGATVCASAPRRWPCTATSATASPSTATASCGWLDDTVIAVLTFGARRPWLIKPLTGRRYRPRRRPDRCPRLLPRQRRPVGDGRGNASPLAARRPQGARPVPHPDLRAVALHVTPRHARHQPVVLRRPPLQQDTLIVTTVSMIVALASPPPSHIVCRP